MSDGTTTTRAPITGVGSRGHCNASVSFSGGGVHRCFRLSRRASTPAPSVATLSSRSEELVVRRVQAPYVPIWALG